jgi:polygalacturonase
MPFTSSALPTNMVAGGPGHDTGHVAQNTAINEILAADPRVYNVRTYGAKGDGSTADHVAIQAAITAANAAGGGVVFLPPGIYIINKYLLMPSSVHLCGAGMWLTTIRCGAGFIGGGTAPLGGGYSMIQSVSGARTNIAISDISFDGNESANRATLSPSGVRVNSYLVDMRSVTGLRIERVSTRNTWTYNIVVWECSVFLVAGCDVQSPNTSGVYDQLDGIHVLGSNQGRVVHNRVDNGIGADADDSLVAHTIDGSLSCYDVVYANNVCRGGPHGTGIQVAGDTSPIRDITIADNVFWGCRAGIATNFFAPSGNAPIRSLTISGNVVRDTTTNDAIWIHNAADGKWEDITITGNVVDGYGSATDQYTFGINVEGGNGSRGVTIVGNTVRNGYSRAIALQEGTAVRDYIIANNIIDVTTAAAFPIAIIAGHCLDGIIEGNIITGPGTTLGIGIFLVSTAAVPLTNLILMGNRIRALATGVQVSTDAGTNMPVRVQFIGNNTQGNGTATSFATATVTSANNL